MSVSLHEVLQNDGEIDWQNNAEDAVWILARAYEMQEIVEEAEETLSAEKKQKVIECLVDNGIDKDEAETVAEAIYDIVGLDWRKSL